MSHLSDLEITRLCAEAMGLTVFWNEYLEVFQYTDEKTRMSNFYAPLADDAQAMAMAQRLRLWCCPTGENDWTVYDSIPGEANVFVTTSSLNRAICECVAKFQQAKAATA